MTEIINHQKPLDEAKEILDRLIGEFRTGVLVGGRLKKELIYIRRAITIAEQEQDQIK